MHIDDMKAFAKAWSGAWEAVGRNTTSNAIQLAFAALNEYSLQDVLRALHAHAKDPKLGQHPPTISHVVAALSGSDNGFPGADEAWGIAAKSLDEYATVIVCDEIMQARDAAMPVVELGDEVGARMAFREAYERAVRSARMQGRERPRWWVSNGTDKQLREQAIRQAVDLGRLTRDALKQITGPDPTLTEACRAFDVQAIEHKTKAKEAADISRKLRSLKDTLETRKTNEFHEAEMERQRIRDEAEARRREVVRRAEEAMPEEEPKQAAK
jgi:hypothetical protein